MSSNYEKGASDAGMPAVESAGKLIPDEISQILGSPPLILGEDPALYQKVLGRFAAELDPQEFSEWVWVKDLTDAVWEQIRLQRLRGDVLNLGFRQGGLKFLLPGLAGAPGKAGSTAREDADALIVGVLAGKSEAIARVDEILGTQGLTREALFAAAFEAKIPTLERVDRMLYGRAKQRDQALLNLKRRGDGRTARPNTGSTAEEIPEERG